MPLARGTRFGPFEIDRLIGAGGMGEVYRARDTKLDRDVALKVLPSALTSDPDRVARFEREAKVLAALNHPHIAHVYGFEDSGTGDGAGPTRALVMELVEGEDLAERIARGPMPVSEVIPLARQIVDAIASAHDRGIVHRDLKPANIKVTSSGAVKLLDFGLAKAVGPPVAGTEAAATITSVATALGVVLGTAAYMSPEQARGQSIDGRTDVWAFGCVLFEMLAGRAVFRGATASDTIAKILEREPDWDELPASTPPTLRRLLMRCLEKNPARRLHAIADARFDMDDARGRVPARIVRWAIVAGVAVLLLGTALWQFLPHQSGVPSSGRVMSLTSYAGIERAPSFSPDGKQVAFSWNGDKEDNEDIYVAIVGSDSPHRVTTDGARDVSPAWKPDGSQIAFARMAGGLATIYLVTPLGAAEQKLAEFAAVPPSGAPVGSDDPTLSWSPDGRSLAVSRVLFGGERGVFVLAQDGTPRPLLSPPAGTAYYGATFSPKGDALAYVNVISGSVFSGFIEVIAIDAADSRAPKGTARRLTPLLGCVNGLAWTADGRDLLYGQSQDPSKISYLWRVPVAKGGAPERLELAGVGAFPAVSTSAQRLAYSRLSSNVDLLRLQPGLDPMPILASTFHEQDASFSPDGSKIAFASDRTGEGTEIWVASAADGAGRRPVSKGAHRPEGSPRWSLDGRRLAFDGLGDDGQVHLYVVDEAGGSIQPIAQQTGSSDHLPSWSRDGKWIYFSSNRSGRFQVWRAAADGGNARQITTAGGWAPMESWDGRTLYFSREADGGRVILSMPIAGGPEQQVARTTFWNYAPAERGLYYASEPQGPKAPYTYEVRFLDSATRTHRVLHRLRLAGMAPGLSVRAESNTILISGVSAVSNDLMRIENFR